MIDREPHTGPFKTRTGIIVGGAYIPQRSPSYGNPMTRHMRPARGIARAFGAVLAVLTLLTTLAVLSACGDRSYVQRIGPDERGIVCYWSKGAFETEGVYCYEAQ